jgi:hypothetical protein
MPDHESNDGRTVTIERTDDGDFMVSDNEGRWIRYGEDVAGNIYQDWNLRGRDLSESEVPDDPDAD